MESSANNITQKLVACDGGTYSKQSLTKQKEKEKKLEGKKKIYE